MLSVEKEKNTAIIKKFLQEKNLAVVATISPEGKPHSAAVNFFLDEDFSLYFLTKSTSSKHSNILMNPAVSLTVYDDYMFPASAQIEGEALVVNTDDQKIKVQRKLIEKLWKGPYLPPILKQPGWGTVLIKVAIKKIKWFQLPTDSQMVKFEYLELA